MVGRERETKTVMATTVPNKGGIGRFASDKCWEFMEENGDKVNKVIVKTDQEPSIKYLVKDLVDRREDGKTIVEEAPVESKGSNGIVERTVQEVEGILRSVYLGLQDRLGRKVSTRERIVAFIPDYVGYLINRLKKGEDGKVGYERCKGKKPTVIGVEFGEKLLFRRRTGQKMEKMNERWQYGIFVGVRRRSNEPMIATKLGVVMARSVKRIPVEKRWTVDTLDWVRHAPWHLYKDAEDCDGDIPEGVSAEEREEKKVVIEKGDSGEKRTKYVDVREHVPRDFYISRKDAERLHRGCPGCNSWFKGAKMPHNEECRETFRRLMKDEAKVRNAETRKAEFEEKIRRKMGEKGKEVEKDESSGGKLSKEESREVKEDSGAKEGREMTRDAGEDLLGSEEEKRIHREYLKSMEEESRVANGEMR